MEKVKVVALDSDGIVFSNGMQLSSYHEDDCCEHHYLWFGDLSLADFDDLEFDLSNDNFFARIEDYGIELIPIKGWSVKIPAYASNNGYYSSELTLTLTDNDGSGRNFDITDCQIWN